MKKSRETADCERSAVRNTSQHENLFNPSLNKTLGTELICIILIQCNNIAAPESIARDDCAWDQKRAVMSPQLSQGRVWTSPCSAHHRGAPGRAGSGTGDEKSKALSTQME